ncbi:SEC-C domain-containing protein [Streptomyces sp. NPDC051572]|uniref:YecA family protein n=1 Tax=Streptomyces sp. NPDC051572 TaxID=3155802 RepID=UPI00344D9400
MPDHAARLDWPRTFQHLDHEFGGPRRKGPCPCGSGRTTRRCHGDRGDGRWNTPASSPLLSDAPTGYQHRKCYAGSSHDCSDRLSAEHWLSADIYRQVADDQGLVTVVGMPWQKGTSSTLPPPKLASKVLCERHNNALSPLDKAVGRVFRILRHFQDDQRDDTDPHGHEFAIVAGADLERWLLKLLWGGLAAKAFSIDGKRPSGLRATADPEQLLTYLFRGGSLPTGWGFYMAGDPNMPFSAEGEVAVRPKSHNGEFWGVGVEFGAIGLRFALGTPDGDPPNVVRHPLQIELTHHARPERKVLALAWDGAYGPPVTVSWAGPGRGNRYPTSHG